MPRTTLSAQPANFWIGAFMVAEGLVGAVLLLLPQSLRSVVVEIAFGSPVGLLMSLLVAVMAGLGCAWLGHRLGLGR